MELGDGPSEWPKPGRSTATYEQSSWRHNSSQPSDESSGPCSRTIGRSSDDRRRRTNSMRPSGSGTDSSELSRARIVGRLKVRPRSGTAEQHDAGRDGSRAGEHTTRLVPDDHQLSAVASLELGHRPVDVGL